MYVPLFVHVLLGRFLVPVWCSCHSVLFTVFKLCCFYLLQKFDQTQVLLASFKSVPISWNLTFICLQHKHTKLLSKIICGISSNFNYANPQNTHNIYFFLNTNFLLTLSDTQKRHLYLTLKRRYRTKRHKNSKGNSHLFYNNLSTSGT